MVDSQHISTARKTNAGAVNVRFVVKEIKFLEIYALDQLINDGIVQNSALNKVYYLLLQNKIQIMKNTSPMMLVEFLYGKATQLLYFIELSSVYCGNFCHLQYLNDSTMFQIKCPFIYLQQLCCVNFFQSSCLSDCKNEEETQRTTFNHLSPFRIFR